MCVGLSVVFPYHRVSVGGVCSDSPSFIVSSLSFLVVSLARFINFIDLCKEPIFGFVDFLYCITALYFFFFFLRFYLFIFRERGREGGRKGEKHRPVACHTCPNRGWPATQACVLTGNRTSDFGFVGWRPTEPHQPGHFLHFTSALTFVSSFDLLWACFVPLLVS